MTINGYPANTIGRILTFFFSRKCYFNHSVRSNLMLKQGLDKGCLLKKKKNLQMYKKHICDCPSAETLAMKGTSHSQVVSSQRLSLFPTSSQCALGPELWASVSIPPSKLVCCASATKAIGSTAPAILSGCLNTSGLPAADIDRKSPR